MVHRELPRKQLLITFSLLTYEKSSKLLCARPVVQTKMNKANLSTLSDLNMPASVSLYKNEYYGQFIANLVIPRHARSATHVAHVELCGGD